MVPTFILEPFDGVGAQLCPRKLAATTPQAIIVASRPATSPSPGVPARHHRRASVRCYPVLIRQVWSWWFRLERRSADGFSRTPSVLACRTRTVWQRWSVPSLPGLLFALTPVPGFRLPSASTARCDEPQACPFITARLVAFSPGGEARCGLLMASRCWRALPGIRVPVISSPRAPIDVTAPFEVTPTLGGLSSTHCHRRPDHHPARPAHRRCTSRCPHRERTLIVASAQALRGSTRAGPVGRC
jgi:hypothetical protein